MSEAEASAAPRCAIVAIVGAPNAGKSSIVNAIVGEKIAIVTHKAQTTRAALRGVAMRGPAQLVLVDTPGLFEPKRRLDRAMVRAAYASLDDADAVAHIVDAAAFAHGAQEHVRALAPRLRALKQKAVLVLNKVDLLPRPDLLAMAQSLFAEGVYSDVFMISARTGDGVEDFAAFLARRAPEGPWLFPADEASDAPARLRAAEITREKVMLRLHDEVPYEITVETEGWRAHKGGAVKIDQTIFVTRDSHKRIVIGAGGATLKAIGQAARAEIAAMAGRPVHLFLFVKVRPNWSEDRARYAAMGLDFDDGPG